MAKTERDVMKDTGNSVILDSLISYWSDRSESYSVQNLAEMECWRKDVWKHLLLEYATESASPLNILDVGTGPGFFAILLAESGHDVHAVDVTGDMLSHARQNAAHYGISVDFQMYDGEILPFSDNSFDMVVSRNILWNIEKPETALAEWCRVLKPGGRVVYFDANWYLYLTDKEQRKSHEEAHSRYHSLYPEEIHDILGPERARDLEKITLKLPLTYQHRPQWDLEALERAGLRLVNLAENLNDVIYDEKERVHYSSTPMFRIVAEK